MFPSFSKRHHGEIDSVAEVVVKAYYAHLKIKIALYEPM